jgi:hypothetical protein
MKTYKDFEPFSKDQAYWERNQLVSALSKIYPSWLGWHKEPDWEDDWRNIVYIEIPVRCQVHGDLRNYMDYRVEIKQLSWHIHKDDLEYFEHLKPGIKEWDGHETEEKYERLKHLHIPELKKWYQFWK